MKEDEARNRYNYLMTLCIRREEAFGPLAMAFVRDHDLGALGLTADEQLSLFIAIARAFPEEPRRYPHKLEYLKKARQALLLTTSSSSDLALQIDQEIEKTSAELQIYNEAFKRIAPSVSRPHTGDRQRVIFESDLPDYFLSVAQERAAAYYREKYSVSDQARVGLNFKGPTRRFEPENTIVHKDVAGACAPFMNARLLPFHLMLPFDIKVSRKPDAPLEAGVRIWYAAEEYSFPLEYRQGRFCSWYDGEVTDVEPGDPHLVYVSVSRVKEQALGVVERPLPPGMPLELGLPNSFLNGADALGPYIQFGCNFKVWFNAGAVALLTQGAPDLHEYGLAGGAGLITRTYASEKLPAYVEASAEPWQEGLSFNYVNIHLRLLAGIETAFVPFNTPLFSVYFVQERQHVEIVDRRAV
jgi:hypothetical protein